MAGRAQGGRFRGRGGVAEGGGKGPMAVDLMLL
jgi:hypothetical protein